MSECPHTDCTNKDLRCHVCIPQGRLYKTQKVKEKKEKKRTELGKVKKHQKEGMEFEERVVRAYNRIRNRPCSGVTPERSTRNLAHQVSGSGNKWFMPGDVTTEEALLECKERGTVNAKGEKQITITKLMLDKIKKEAGSGKFPGLPFGFKGEDNIYIAADFNIWLELVQTIKLLKDRITDLEGGLKDGEHAE